MVQQLYAVERRPSAIKAILLAGLLAATLDALFAIADFTISTHLNPVRIFWYIASAVFGQASTSKVLLTAGVSTQFMYAAAGVLFHYFIAYAFVTLLFFVYPVLKKIFTNNVVIIITCFIFTFLIASVSILTIFAGNNILINIFLFLIAIICLLLTMILLISFFMANKNLFNSLKKILSYKLFIPIVYGICVWLVMGYIVLPLAMGGLPTYTLKTILSVSYLIIAIGLIGSVFADKYYTKKQLGR